MIIALSKVHHRIHLWAARSLASTLQLQSRCSVSALVSRVTLVVVQRCGLWWCGNVATAPRIEAFWKKCLRKHMSTFTVELCRPRSFYCRDESLGAVREVFLHSSVVCITVLTVIEKYEVVFAVIGGLCNAHHSANVCVRFKVERAGQYLSNIIFPIREIYSSLHITSVLHIQEFVYISKSETWVY